MKHFIKDLNKEVGIPEGWYIVKSGSTKKNDKLWFDLHNKFLPVDSTALGNNVKLYHCVIRQSKPKNYFVYKDNKYEFPKGYYRVKNGTIKEGDLYYCEPYKTGGFYPVSGCIVNSNVGDFVCILRPTNPNQLPVTKTENTVISEPFLVSSPPIWTEDMIIKAVKPYYQELKALVEQANKIDISVFEADHKIVEVERILMKIFGINATDYEKYTDLVKKLS